MPVPSRSRHGDRTVHSERQSYRDRDSRDRRNIRRDESRTDNVRQRSRSPSRRSHRSRSGPEAFKKSTEALVDQSQLYSEQNPGSQSKPSFFRPDQPRQTHMSRTQKEREDKQAKKWVAGEDEFVLKQMKRGAMIRVKENRAKPIDWLSANLKMIEADPSVYDEDFDEGQEFEMPVPFAIIEDLDLQDIYQLIPDIDEYLKIDLQQPNADFWQMMKVVCLEKQKLLAPDTGVDYEARVIEPVSVDIDAVLKDKTYNELIELEEKINQMLESKGGMVDVDFWSRLLKELVLRKARSKLQEIHELVIAERVRKLQKVQAAEALRAKLQISSLIKKGKRVAAVAVPYNPDMDVVPPLISFKQFEDVGITIKNYSKDEYFKELENKREAVRKLGFVAMKQQKDRTAYVASAFHGKSLENKQSIETDPAQALYDKELARATGENEENFVSETQLPGHDSVSGLIKPRYFNRVMLGYDWNKYNQTHFTSENPPPKVVQGYKFNIFYPDLINAQKAPSYKIIRDSDGKAEKHRLALTAGENDTCIIKFQAQPPYQDIAFRVVDRQWDNSSHRGAGFKSKFENGVLQLHFRFKKVFYRK